MKKPWIAAMALGAGLLATGTAQAGVHWSIGVNLPIVAPAPVYVEPQPVYVAPPPPPVYVQPAPVYYGPPRAYWGPAPVVVYRGWGPGYYRHHGPYGYYEGRGHWRHD